MLHRLSSLVRKGLLPACLASGSAIAWAGHDDELTLLYQERPPYTETRADGSVGGLIADPVAAAILRAGLKVRWAKTPSQRQLALIQQGSDRVCGLGWFRNAARERLGKFSAVVYQDRPLAALVRSGVPFSEGMTLNQALSHPQARLLVKDGFSYGARVDAWLRLRPANVVSTAAEPASLIDMLLVGRADWMLVAPEEAEVLLRRVGDSAVRETGQSLSMVPLEESDKGFERHLYCNPSVPDEVLQRIDKELRSLRVAPQ